jgi:hypothetical protein
MNMIKCLGVAAVLCLLVSSAMAQLAAPLNGSCSVTESWSLTLYRGAGDTVTMLPGGSSLTLGQI